MPFLILLLFIGVPIAEIALFIEIGGQIGLGWTLATIVATALIGTWLVRQQGLQTLANARTAAEENRLPVAEVITGVCILVAGVLLLTPGFLTDAIGFVLLIPPLRCTMATAVIGRLKQSGRFTMHMTGAGFEHPQRSQEGRGSIIDGEFEEIDPTGNPDPGSPWNKSDEGPDPTLPSRSPRV